MRAATLFLSMIGLVCAGISGLLGYTEWRGFAVAKSGGSYAAEIALTEAPATGSLRMRRAVIDPCLSQFSDFRFLLMPTEDREKLAVACVAYAESIDPAPGGLAEAALAKANAYAVLGANAESGAALLRSHALAPRVGWLAQRRADLAVENIDLVTPEELSVLRADLSTMAEDWKLIDLLAVRMKTWPEPAREEIISAVESAPANYQRRFVSRVEQGGL